MINTLDSNKSNEIADASRAEGNKLYCDRKFFDALLKYNESLCYAVCGDESVGLAFANRSAVYFEMKLYGKCLKNIAIAKSNGYPEKNYQILDKRAEKCIEQIKAGNEVQQQLENPFDFIKLSYKENSRLPFVVDCLELRQSDDFGRFIVTTQDLNAGDILAIEEPHFKVIKSDSRYESCPEMNRYQRCAVCLQDNLMDLIPCTYCTSTMYCGDKCMEFAEKNHHNYECAIIEVLLKTGIMQMAMRVFFQSLNMFNGNVDDLQTFLYDCKKPSTCVYDFDFSDHNDALRGKNFLLSAYCLARNEEISSNESPEKIFMLHPILSEMWQSHGKFIKNFINRILKVGDSNFHGICGWSIQKYENNEPQMIGVGCYPFISLINHACVPNVNRIYAEGKMFLLVERPIRKGEQLFDCYKTTFFTQSRAERQMNLLQNYSFHCQCEACTKNYPLFHALKSTDKKLLKFAKKSKSEVSKIESNDAKRKFVEYCSIIQEHHAKGFPSSEIVLLQECIQQCLSIIIKPKILFQ